MQTPMQFLWLIDAEVDPEDLNRVASGLAEGPLGVRLVSSRVPFARPVWLPATAAASAVVDREPVAVGEQLRWADEQVGADLDVWAGRGWRLSAAQVHDGSSVVSLVVSHTLTDGQGMVAAVTAAVTATAAPAKGLTHRPGLLDDLRDAVVGGFADYARLGAAVASGFGDTRAPHKWLGNAVRGAFSGVDTHTADRPSTVAVTVDTEQFTRTAQEGQGTPTGLSVAIVANVIRTLGESTGPVRIAMPVSHRGGDDSTAANKVALTRLNLSEQHGRYTNLSDIRVLSREAYRRAATAGPATMDGVDGMLSSVGELPPAFTAAFGPSTTIIPRAIGIQFPASSTFQFDKTTVVFRTFTETANTFTFLHPDPNLATHITDELDAWNLHATTICRTASRADDRARTRDS